MSVKKWIIKVLGGIPKDELAKREKTKEGEGLEERPKSEREEKVAKSETGDSIEYMRNTGSEASLMALQSERSYATTKSERSGDPLLAIYEKLARIEEITRIIDERLVLLDSKVATREDSKEIKEILIENSKNQRDLDSKLQEIDKLIRELKNKEKTYSTALEMATSQINEIKKEKEEISKRIELLEAHKRILELLKEKPRSSLEIAKDLGFSRQYVWERLQELKTAGYVDSRKEGRKNIYYLISDDVMSDMSTDIF